MTRHCNRLS